MLFKYLFGVTSPIIAFYFMYDLYLLFSQKVAVRTLRFFYPGFLVVILAGSIGLAQIFIKSDSFSSLFTLWSIIGAFSFLLLIELFFWNHPRVFILYVNQAQFKELLLSLGIITGGQSRIQMTNSFVTKVVIPKEKTREILSLIKNCAFQAGFTKLNKIIKICLFARSIALVIFPIIFSFLLLIG